MSSQSTYCGTACYNDALRQHRFKFVRDVGHANGMNAPFIKKFIINENGMICSICKLTEWMGQPIPLIMDHINGNSNDSSISNLRLVCGNCDMQLPTYKSKNKNSGRHYRRERYAEGKSF